jgi:hypothetical protein
MNVVVVGWDCVDWISLCQDKDRWRSLVNGVMNPLVLQNAGKLSSGYASRGHPRSAQLHIVCQSVMEMRCCSLLRGTDLHVCLCQ